MNFFLYVFFYYIWEIILINKNVIVKIFMNVIKKYIIVINNVNNKAINVFVIYNKNA